MQRSLNLETVVNTVLQLLFYKSQGHLQFWLIQFQKFSWFTRELPLRRAKLSSVRHAGGRHQRREYILCSASNLHGLDVSAVICSIWP